MTGATPKRIEILTFIRDYVEANRCSPTLQEIADDIVCSKMTISEHLSKMEAIGMLTQKKSQIRSIELTEEGLALIEPRKCPHCNKPL